jgi:hypothetical protein
MVSSPAAFTYATARNDFAGAVSERTDFHSPDRSGNEPSIDPGSPNGNDHEPPVRSIERVIFPVRKSPT